MKCFSCGWEGDNADDFAGANTDRPICWCCLFPKMKEERDGTMTKDDIKNALVEFFSEFTLVTAYCEKKIQEQQFEPYTVSAGQAMIVHVDEKDEAYAMMMENCDRQIVQEFSNRGFDLAPEE